MIAAALGLVATAGCGDDSGSGGGGSKHDMGPGGSGGMGGSGGGGAGGGGAGGEGGAGGGGGANCVDDTDCTDAQFCAKANPDDLTGTCHAGCRTSPNSCTGGQTCNDQHQCVTPPCHNDGDCGMGTFCNTAAGTCDPGCRTNGDCAADQQCDIPNHTCVGTVICCGQDNSCSQVAMGACDGQVLMHATSCDPDPCGTPCPGGDADCAAGQFCGGDGRCNDGCRPADTSTCPTDQVCDPDKHTCEDHPCDTDADCPDTFYCDSDGPGATNNCRTGCRIDPNNCEGDLTCLQVGGDHLCSSICDPADPNSCDPATQYCDPATTACRDLCGHHADCLMSEACDFATQHCEAGLCRDDDDGSEPNDDADHATPINLMPIGQVRAGQVMGHVICEGNPDLYLLHLDRGERARIDLVFQQGDGNLDLHLSTTDGNEVAAAATLLTPERIEYPAAGAMNVPGADYILQVVGSGGINPNGAHYTINITVVSGENGGCFPDEADTNPNGDDNNRRQAHLLGQQALVDSTDAYVGSVCGLGDEDWFHFPMHPGDGLRTELTAAVGTGNLALELWAASTLAAGGGVGNPDVGPNQPNMALQPTVEHRADGTTVYSWGIDADMSTFHDEDWFLRVRGANPTDVGDYALQVHFHRGSVMCPEDASEPNDAAGSATDLAQVMGLTGADGFLIPDRDLDVALQAGICPAFDEDFFCLRAAANDQLQAWITSDGFLGEATVEFVNEQGQQRGQPGTLGGNHATVAQVADGNVCIRVDGVDAGQGAYQLHLHRHNAGEQGCGIDVAETGAGAVRNDSAAVATQLMPVAQGVSSYDFNNGYLCNSNNTNDNDWYSFNVAGEGDSRVCVAVDFNQPDGNVDVQLYRDLGEGTPCASTATCRQPDADGHVPGGECVAGRCEPSINDSTTQLAPELISRLKSDGTPAGQYWVRVFSSNGAENAYNLSVSVVGNEACQPDGREGAMGNNDLDHATYLGGGSHRLCDAWICQDSDLRGDYYAVDVAPGEDLTAHIAFQYFVDGGLQLDAFAPDPMNPDMVVPIGFNILNFNAQCLNLHGGQAMNRVYLRVRSTFVFQPDGEPDGQSRIDYALSVVPTHLDQNPQGECITLSGGVDPQQQGWPVQVDLP
jgi:hypothetical protein